MTWYVTNGQGVVGPYTEAQMIGAIHRAEVTAEHRVQIEGTKDWVPVSTHEPFAEALERVRGATATGPETAKVEELSSRGRSIAWLVGLSVFAFVVYEAMSAPASLTTKAVATADAVAAPPRHDPDAPGSQPDTPQRQIARAAIQKSADAWNSYDALSSSRQNKVALAAAFGEAMASEAPMDFISKPALDKINRREYRRRAAPLILPEVRASGEDADVLVPSEDRAKCLLWGSQWAKESDSLTTMGFHSIHCDNPSRIWALE